MAGACPRCGSVHATIGPPYTMRSAEYQVEQAFVNVACRGKCLDENGPSKRTAGNTRKEFRFRHSLPETNTQKEDR